MVRALVLLGFAALLVLGAIEYGPTVMERLGVSGNSSDLSHRPGNESAFDPAANPAETAEPAEPEPAPAGLYRYFDATGSLHFVDSLERVPEPYRSSAKLMGKEKLPALTHAETKQPRRPFGYSSSVRRTPRSSAQAPARQAASAEVVVYSTSWCGWCRKTMAWLDARGVEYENRDIEKNDTFREELLEKTGKTTIPMVEIDGEIVRGFDPDRMGELL